MRRGFDRVRFGLIIAQVFFVFRVREEKLVDVTIADDILDDTTATHSCFTFIAAIIVLLVLLKFKRQHATKARFHIGKALRQELRVIVNRLICYINHIEINSTDKFLAAFFHFLINIGGIFAVLIVVELRKIARFVAQAHIFILSTELATKNALSQPEVKLHIIYLEFTKDVQFMLICKVFDIADVNNNLFHISWSPFYFVILLYLQRSDTLPNRGICVLR